MRIYTYIASLVRKHPWAIIAVTLLVTAAMGVGLVFIKGELKYEGMLPADFPSVKAIKALARDFDGISYETIVIESPTTATDNNVVRFLLGLEDFIKEDPRFNRGQVETMPGLQGADVPESLKEPVPVIQDYMTPFIANIKRVLAETGFNIKLSTITSELIKSQTGKDFKETVEQEYLAEPQVKEEMVGEQKFLTPDYKVAKLMIKIGAGLTDEQQVKLGNDLEDLFREKLQDPSSPMYVKNLKVNLAGDATLARDFDRHIRNKTILLFLLSIALVIVILFMAFRRTTDAVWPVVTMLVSLIWTFGLLGYLGIPYSVASVAIMPLLLGHALTFVVPFVARYYEETGESEDAMSAIKTTLTTVGITLFPMAATSVAGFLVFEFSVIPTLREFGLASAIGTIFLFFLCITFLPALMLLRDRRAETSRSDEEREKLKTHFDGFRMRQQHSIFARGTDRALAWFGKISTANSFLVIVIGTALIVVGLATSFSLTTDSDLRKLVPSDLPSIHADHLVEKYFGPDQTDVIMVRGDVLTPESIAAMKELEETIYNDPRNSFRVYDRKSDTYVVEHHYDRNAITGLSDVVAGANNGQPPSDSTQVGAALKLAADNGGYVGGVVSENGKAALISLNGLAAETADQINTKMEILTENSTRVLNGTGLTYELGGITPIIKDLTRNIIPTETWSSLLSLILCGLLLMIIFRSIPYGAITLTVALAGVAAEIAFLTLMRYPIDVVTSLASALVIGIGSNFGILFTHRFMQTMRQGNVEPLEAIISTMRNLGRANVVAALSTIGGFLLIMFSQIQPIKRFGGVTAFGIAISLVASLTIMPALLYRFSLHRKVNEDAVRTGEPGAETV